MLNYNKLGAKEIKTANGSTLHFGVLLPEIDNTRYKLSVNIINENRFFDSSLKKEFSMNFANTMQNYNYWELDIDTKLVSNAENKFLYWFSLRDIRSNNIVADNIIDPFAREYGLGKYSAFSIGYQSHTWSDSNWETPRLKDLIVYELHINEFGKDIEGTINRLDYLQELGVNCIEIMPVHNIKDTTDWGYVPIGYFGVDERFGNRQNLQELIDAAHQKQIAVILDVVFGHTAVEFTYYNLYKQLNIESPFSYDCDAWGGRLVNFNKSLPLEFYEAAMHNYFDNYHVDGLRFDCVPEYREAYSRVVKAAYQLNENNWFWLKKNGKILCAEDLQNPIGTLINTETNCTWQNDTFQYLTNIAYNNSVGDNLYKLGLNGFGCYGYPDGKYPFQYIENHDHKRFICNFDNNLDVYDFDYSSRRKLWYKIQPYLIGQFMAKGIPFLWEGQELCEDYFLEEGGMSRIKISRDVRWEYLFDASGKGTNDLVKRLIAIRKQNSIFTEGEYVFYNDYNKYQSKKVLLFHRKNATNIAYIALNFGEYDVDIEMPVSVNNYNELLQNQTETNVSQYVRIPSNYGRIWYK